MLLLSPSEAALAIGVKCGGSAPADDDPQLVAILNYITPRVEDACNVYSLTRTTNTDKFIVQRMPAYNSCRWPVPQEVPRLSLRLSNGFVVADSVVVTDPDGEELDLTDSVDMEREMGMVYLDSWVRGTYTVTYDSGFEPVAGETPADADTQVMTGVPMWMKGIAISALVLWYRTVVMSPKGGTKEISHGTILNHLHREIATRVYQRYMRPRVDCLCAERR